MKADLKNYYSGTSGLLLPVPNKLHYPEAFKDASRLHFYGSLTNSIEINSSFYKIPLAATVAKWAADVPDDFKFTFKLFREITHGKALLFDEALLKRFMEVIDGVGQKKGSLLVQFPPSVRMAQLPQLASLMAMLRELDAQQSWKIAFEFRHASLYHDRVEQLLHRYDIGLVIHDKPPAISLMNEPHTNFVYLRFHGPDGSYRGSYGNDLLAEYASYITDWLAEGKEVFVYFNNTMGNAFGNLVALRGMLGSE